MGSQGSAGFSAPDVTATLILQENGPPDIAQVSDFR